MATIDLDPLRNCTRLERLYLRKSLTEVDLSPLEPCVLLEELDLRFNQLTEVDVSTIFQLPRLETLKLDERVSLVAQSHLKDKSPPPALKPYMKRIKWR
jgi:Leucine-rich repeat (LRR) protein